MSVEQIKEWLLSKGITLWGTYDLSQPERLHEAAVWFQAQQEDLDGWWMGRLVERATGPFPRWDVV